MSHSVSVVIPPPAFDLNSYDYLERTCDEILSDAASFDSSFDDYSGHRTMDGSYEPINGPLDGHHLRKDPEHARSPYFASQKHSKKRTVSTRQIMRMDSTCDYEESDEDEANTSKTLGSSPGVISNSKGEEIEAWENDLVLDEMEANAFALVNADDQERLVRSISEHPFFQSDAYPVKRSERREFVDYIRQVAMGAGLDEVTKENIVVYVKKLYLTANGWGHVCESGSEYGDEINDGPAKITKSAKKTKKDRKRKRQSSDKPTDRPSKKTMDSANTIDCQGLKSTDTGVEGHSEKSAKPILDLTPSKAQIPETVPDSLSKTKGTVHLDPSETDESALSTPTKRCNNQVNRTGSKSSRQPLSTLHEDPTIPPDGEKNARLSETSATRRLTFEEPPQNTDPPRPDDPAVSKASSKKKKRNRKRAKKRRARKASKSSANPRDPRMEGQKTSQPVSTVAPEKSKPVAASENNIDDPKFWSLDF